MRDAANVPTQKLKLVTTTTQAPTDDEETTSRLVFTRKRKAIAAPTKHSHSNGRAPSHHVTPSEGQNPPRDMMVVREGKAKSSKRGNLWNPSLDATTFLEEVLLRAEEKEKLMAHDENHLVREAIRKFGQVLATCCLAAAKMK